MTLRRKMNAMGFQAIRSQRYETYLLYYNDIIIRHSHILSYLYTRTSMGLYFVHPHFHRDANTAQLARVTRENSGLAPEKPRKSDADKRSEQAKFDRPTTRSRTIVPAQTIEKPEKTEVEKKAKKDDVGSREKRSPMAVPAPTIENNAFGGIEKKESSSIPASLKNCTTVSSWVVAMNQIDSFVPIHDTRKGNRVTTSGYTKKEKTTVARVTPDHPDLFASKPTTYLPSPVTKRKRKKKGGPQGSAGMAEIAGPAKKRKLAPTLHGTPTAEPCLDGSFVPLEKDISIEHLLDLPCSPPLRPLPLLPIVSDKMDSDGGQQTNGAQAPMKDYSSHSRVKEPVSAQQLFVTPSTKTGSSHQGHLSSERKLRVESTLFSTNKSAFSPVLCPLGGLLLDYSNPEFTFGGFPSYDPLDDFDEGFIEEV